MKEATTKISKSTNRKESDAVFELIDFVKRKVKVVDPYLESDE